MQAGANFKNLEEQSKSRKRAPVYQPEPGEDFNKDVAAHNLEVRIFDETRVWLRRVGSILILLFLVQVFIGLYRYQTRLAAYYDARADALLLSDGTSAAFTVLTDPLTPGSVEFANHPKTPMDQLTKLAGLLRK